MRRGSILRGFSAVVLAIAVTAGLFFWPANSRAADPERGRLLYENHCTVCHTSVVHVREDRKSNSRDEIRNWVQRWQKELNLQWTSGEIDDVIEYLNDRYYQFKVDS